MSSNTFGERYRVTTFGESHGPAVGVVIDGLRPGLELDLEAVQRELDRRRPGQSALSSPRKEADRMEVLSGVFEGKTTGAPIAIIVRNRDPKSQHYEALKALFRPGHADFSFQEKYGIRDWRGGGRSSGRETVSRVAAGAIARQLLSAQGVEILGHVVRIGEVTAPSVLEGASLSRGAIDASPARCADPEAGARMESAVAAAQKAGDSLGGIVEVVARGLPAGWGDPVAQKLDAELAAALVSIGAVKGVEFGAGFALAAERGSQSNDALLPGPNAGDPPVFETNRMGGVLGGISSGKELVCRLAVKPTSSIRVPQQTVDSEGNATTLRVRGRHDPCICPRVVPVAEAMVALVLCDAYLRQQALQEAPPAALEADHELARCETELLAAVARHRELRRKRRAEEHADQERRNARQACAQTLGLDAETLAAVEAALTLSVRG